MSESWMDISMPIGPGMPRFPGDPEVELRPAHALAQGSPYNLSWFSAGTHVGTHVDPPLHFLAGGAGIDAIPPERTIGPAVLIDIDSRAESIGPDVRERLPPRTERVLFRTRNSERWARSEGFFPDYVALSPAGAEALVSAGVRLVGIDALSIERDTTGRFPVHHRLLGSGVLILEGLRLAGAPTGPVELVCLPLRIQNGDGGPARALLRRR